MKILGVPITTEDMVHSVSMSGITTLVQSRYKYRHHGSKEVVQTPNRGFQLRRNENGQFKPKHKKQRSGWQRAKKKEPKQTGKVKLQQYTINKKEVSHRIRNYVNQMKGEKLLYFWTITFPPGTSDDTAYILLNKWLTRLRTERMIKEYLWISERQQIGTIHFHMTINRRMDVQKANRFMRASIMHCINNQEIIYNRTNAVKYNGVDICKDRKTKRVVNFAKQNKQKALSYYLTKYVTKNNEAFKHLAWHSSREYSNLIIAVRFTRQEMLNSNCINLIDRSNPLVGEYFVHYRWKGRPPDDLLLYLANINQHIQTKLYETTTNDSIRNESKSTNCTEKKVDRT